MSYGKNIGEGLVAAMIACFVIGGVVMLGLYFLVSWVVAHVSIGWN